MPKLPKVTLGVCGGVAAYKAAELVRTLQQADLDVHVVMTRAAEEFIRPLTFSSLTGHKVITSLWPPSYNGKEEADAQIEHIAEARTTDLLLVAPATAHTLAKFAHGLADDFLSTLYLATTARVIVAPAMNVNMWQHAATKANLESLRQSGVTIVEPDSGYLACGMEGGGRLAEISIITAAALAALRQRTSLRGQTILITAGGTREALDPVRFIGNRSSGKMGYALAAAAASRGARVMLVTAPTALDPPAGCEVIRVVTAEEMRDAVLSRLSEATAVIKAAAVSDFRATSIARSKMKRGGPLTLSLESTDDIVQRVVERRRPGTRVIAFAAETENMLENAQAKLLRKGVDAVVANDVSQIGIGFDADANAVAVVTADGIVEIGKCSKLEVAHKILDHVL
jgi:phosphopantothenoylcysteine decarboxylase/phosphopantothenate--cysteine ligase